MVRLSRAACREAGANVGRSAGAECAGAECEGGGVRGGGVRFVCLQASPEGEPVYRRPGFREITRYPWFVAPRIREVATP